MEYFSPEKSAMKGYSQILWQLYPIVVDAAL